MSNEDTISAHLTHSVADALIALAGITQDERGRWIVPDEAADLTGQDDTWTWAKDEALKWALVIIASVDEPELLAWS
jgi:hypothetical protein